ncbi:hypothetical protein OEA41_008599 [Lepraria neglecta]|uniref:PKS/mFAS DH domain-containing protein n=1 Tax=Lepraria neglecta TaxID=209136 RepID=A0AAD9Z0F2_9LECA|nr:hypothetical protein OEA41_008599 [Lepraria neglecta]
MPAQFEYSFIIHPATLDSCIHAVFAIGARCNQQDQGTPVPTFIEEMFISQSIQKTPGHVFNVYAQSKMKDVGTKANTGPGQQSESLAIFDREQTDFEPRITFNGLVFTSLANNTQEETEIEERRIYYQTEWQPDPSFLSSVQVTEISAAFRKSFPQDDQACISQQATFYYAERALEVVSAENFTAMQPHHRKLYASLTGFCSAVRNGQLGMYPTHNWLCLISDQRAAIFARVRQIPYGTLLCPVGENLSWILRQEVDPLSVMMEDDRLERYYQTYEPIEQFYQQAAVYIRLLGNKNPHLNILEIGAGTGGATLPILEALSNTGTGPPNFTNYDFTDLSPAFFEKAREKIGRWSEFVTFKKLDIESDPAQQGYKPGLYDLIVAVNVVHATSRIENTMKRIRSLLKPGGTLVLMEITVKTMAASLIFGTLPGGQKVAEEESRADGPLLTEEQWDNTLHTTGFTGANSILWDMPDPASHHGSTIISTAPVENRKGALPITIIADADTSEPYSARLRSLLINAGIEHNTASLSEYDPRNRIYIVLCELTRPTLRNPSPSDYEAVKRVTEGALVESSNPDLNLVTGLARTIRVEKGDTMIATLDLDAQNPLSATARAVKIFSVVIINFGKENSAATDVELEYVERNGTVMIPRIIKDQRLDSSVLLATGSAALELQPYCQDSRPLRAEIRTPGLLDSIRFVADDRISGELPDNCVKVQVKESGINFRDIMTALGQISIYPLGYECCGVVSAIGKFVQDLRLGDHIIATVKDGCFCNTIRASTKEVELIPDNIPFEVTAALPVIYFTAY